MTNKKCSLVSRTQYLFSICIYLLHDCILESIKIAIFVSKHFDKSLMIGEINVLLGWFFGQGDEHHVDSFSNHVRDVVLIDFAENIVSNFVLMQIPSVDALQCSLIFLVISHGFVVLVDNLASDFTVIL